MRFGSGDWDDKSLRKLKVEIPPRLHPKSNEENKYIMPVEELKYITFYFKVHSGNKSVRTVA
jgi:hypothetical protein